MEMKANTASPAPKRTPLLLFALYQIAFGLLGIYAAVTFIQAFLHRAVFVWIGTGFLGLYVLLLLCGLSYVRGKKAWSKTAFFLQLLQIFSFSLFGCKFLFTAGAVLGIELVQALNFRIMPYSAAFELGYKSKTPFFIVNLVPVMLCTWLTKEYRHRSQKIPSFE